MPVLWDKKRRTIVNNESSEIIRMLNSAFDAFTNVRTDYYPAELRAEIDRINDLVYPNVNNGVYRAGFATTQDAYEEAARGVFATFDQLEQRLSGQRYLAGRQITEADWRLFTTLIRFDSGLLQPFQMQSAARRRLSQSRGIICASFIKCRALPTPSASITSSGTITAASARSIRPASCRSGR